MNNLTDAGPRMPWHAVAWRCHCMLLHGVAYSCMRRCMPLPLPAVACRLYAAECRLSVSESYSERLVLQWWEKQTNSGTGECNFCSAPPRGWSVSLPRAGLCGESRTKCSKPCFWYSAGVFQPYHCMAVICRPLVLPSAIVYCAV